MTAGTLLASAAVLLLQAAAQGGASRWKNGLPDDLSFLPLAVWLQDPKNAPRYREAGINLYVGLWRGPTAEQLADLKAAGMKVICHQGQTGLSHPGRDVIVGWTHGDEPDNAQPKPGGGYGPPIPPEKIAADYARIRAADPTRPVPLNLGQGVAWDDWIGRGVRRNRPEDYPEYVKGCDIVSFDSGSTGIIYFVHQFRPRFIEASLLEDPALLKGVAEINRQIRELAPAINSPTVPDGAEIRSSKAEIPVAGIVKRLGRATFVFAAAMRDGATRASFTVHGVQAAAAAEVLGENRRIPVASGRFEDDFKSYEVHLYKIE